MPVFRIKSFTCSGISQRGLTLIEMVMAILIMSIISIGLTQFITNASSSYADAAARNQASSAGRIVIDRMAMELRQALPESIRVTAVQTLSNPVTGNAGDQCIEYIPALAASTYLDPAFLPESGKTSFDIVDSTPSQVGASGRYAVIYPTSSLDLYRNTYTNIEAIVPVTISDPVVGDGKQRITSTDHSFKRRSAVSRVFITGQPVSYCVSGNRLYRYSDYGFHQDQLWPVAPNGSCASLCLPSTTPQRVLVSDRLDHSALNSNGPAGRSFDWVRASRQRNGLVHLQLNFNVDGQQLLLNHEVMQQVTP